MTHGLLPAPAHSGPVRPGEFILRNGSTVEADDALRPAVRPWVRRLETAFEVDLLSCTPPPVPNVRFGVDSSLPAGGYVLRVDEDGVDVRCADLAGAHAATQTLTQLAGPRALRTAPGMIGGACPSRSRN